MSSNDKLTKFIEELKAKNDIVSVVSRYVPLERKGRSFWGRCPFHSEKTPSFSVNDYDQFYHCFGCGVGGDVIKFIQNIESVDFMGAVHILADLAHMEVPSFSGAASDEEDIKKRKQEKERLLDLMRDTARHYVANLKSPMAKVGIMYFEKRNISPEVARMFGIGFSLNFNEIIDFLKSKNYTLEEMEKAGVIKYKDGRPYDALGGRVIFPIIDTSNNVIAFCGRTLEPHPTHAKYINTADTVLFSKSKNLFAINLVKKNRFEQGKIDYMIVVEGQMDAVSLHKAGFTTAVASMGTALTQEQAKLIKRFAEKVYICYDGDTAGKKATLRGLDILKSTGLDVYVMSMPEGLDPDDVINKYGEAGYKKLLQKALPLVDFKLEFLKNTFDTTTNEGRAKFLNEAILVLQALDEVEREVYIDKVSEISGVLKDFVRRQVGSNVQQEVQEPIVSHAASIEQNTRGALPQDVKSVQAEKFILSAMLHRKPYAFFKTDVREYFTELRQEFYVTIQELLSGENGGDIVKAFYEKYSQDESEDGENSKSEQASEIINYIYKNASDENDLKYYKDCVSLVVKAYCDREVERLTKQLEDEVDKAKRLDIMKKIKEILDKNQNKKVD